MKEGEKKNSGYGHILKYTGLLGGVQVFSVLMGMVRNKVAALFISIAGIGIADLFCKTVETVTQGAGMGLGLSSVRRLSRLYERGDEKGMELCVKVIRSWTLMAAILGGLLCLALAPALSLFSMGSYDFTTSYLWLSAMPVLSILLSGEVAILKAMRRLRRMATVSAIGALASVLFTVPCYWILGQRGIVPALVATVFVSYILTLHAATRIFPYRIGFRDPLIRAQGKKLLKTGAPYAAAGFIAAAAEWLVRSYISQAGSILHVGLYAVGFTLTVSYARMIFVAMDADYFPRLSAAMGDKVRMNTMTNCQTDVLVMLMVPFLITFALSLPLAIRLLYTEEFVSVVPMVLCSMFYMYFKAIYTPVAYLSLAAGDSVVYFVMEALYNVVFVVSVIVGFSCFTLVGAGIGLAVANLFDLLLIYIVYTRRYGFRFQSATVRRFLLQGILLLVGMFAAWRPELWIKAPLGISALVLSAWISWRLLSRETSLVEKLRASWRKIRTKG